MALLDYLENVTGTREGHDKRIVDVMRKLRESA